ncbi:hypothetical protein [Amaricoccus sp. W119]|uniref:hypothetical protein n=1 Tax=Amaricoccus sp. W119 TaxID=3391833 RepID=UPI0039A6C312
MLTRSWLRGRGPAALLLAAVPSEVPAVEFGNLSALDLRAACVAYLQIDLGARYRAGALSQRHYGAEASALASLMRGEGGRPNAGLERRIDAMMEWIAAERPGDAEVAAKAEQCRGVLGL